MKQRCIFLLTQLALFGVFVTVHSAPLVENVTATQREGTHLVDVQFDLSGGGFQLLHLSLEASSDGGTTFTVPVRSVSGDVGAGITPGAGKMIVWNAGADWSGNFNEQMRFRVIADDGFAVIPSGPFQMGLTSGDSAGNAPSIEVTVSRFYLAEKLVTLADWETVRDWAAQNGYDIASGGAGKEADHPVQSVTWWNAVKWCNARSEMEGLTPCYTVGGEVMRTGFGTVPDVDWSANGYRLPTEAEWEKAARGGLSGVRFPWGTDTVSHGNANFRNDGAESYADGNSGHHPDYADGGEPFTSPVGSFAPNGFGLFDMAGNAAEWCWDRYVVDYYLTSDGTTDPRGPAGSGSRVIRGGSWDDTADRLRAGARRSLAPGSAVDTTVGFRLARGRLIDNFISVPGGTFTLGRTSGDADSNAPPVEVTLSSFHLQETETTKELWDEVRDWSIDNGYTGIAPGIGAGAANGPDHPVHSISWFDVIKWCNARSEMEGLEPCYTVSGEVMRTGQTQIPEVNWNANGYRMPTEAEWEMAARAGVAGVRFPTGSDEISHDDANFDNSGGESYALGTTGFHPDYSGGSPPHTSPVGSFPANAYGLFDMAGNVFEYCWDVYDANYYPSISGATDPRGPDGSGFTANRVIRGGAWENNASSARSSTRTFANPLGPGEGLGFRPARSHP